MSLKAVLYYLVLASLLVAVVYQLVEAHDFIEAENGRKAFWRAAGAILSAASASLMLLNPPD